LIRKIAIVSIIYLILLLGAIFLFFHNPAVSEVFLPCPIRLFTGFYCPGCGSTRELYSLLHGEIYQAFRFNPALFILLPFIVFYILAKSIYFIRGIKHDPLHKVPSSVFVTILILLLVYAIMRNIPLFSFLAPTVVK
jgi:hypothetical protein